MKYSVLGSTGVKVSRICLGTATFGVAPTAQDADQLVGAAIDLGINFVDTADVYGNMPVFDRPGAPAAAEREPAEQILGRALRGRRDEMVDRHQVQRHRRPRHQRPWPVPPTHHPSGRDEPAPPGDRLHRPLLRPRPRPGHPVGADPGGLRRPDPAGQDPLRRPVQPSRLAGHPRSVDRRRPAPAGTRRRPGEVQPHRPRRRTGARPGLPAVRAVDRPVRAAARRPARRPGASSTARSPATSASAAAGFSDAEIGIAREVDRLSRDWGLAPYQVSLAWLLSRPAVASVIVGAETVDELRANATAADVELDAAQLDALTALAAEPGAFHHRAGDGPEPPATARLTSTEPTLSPAALTSTSKGTPSCLEPTRPPSTF